MVEKWNVVATFVKKTNEAARRRFWRRYRTPKMLAAPGHRRIRRGDLREELFSAVSELRVGAPRPPCRSSRAPCRHDRGQRPRWKSARSRGTASMPEVLVEGFGRMRVLRFQPGPTCSRRFTMPRPARSASPPWRVLIRWSGLGVDQQSEHVRVCDAYRRERGRVTISLCRRPYAARPPHAEPCR